MSEDNLRQRVAGCATVEDVNALFEELERPKLATIKEFNRLTALFLTHAIEAEKKGTVLSDLLPRDFWHELQMVKAEMRSLFSPTAVAAYMTVERMIPLRNYGTDEFVEARDAAMRIFYEEISAA